MAVNKQPINVLSVRRLGNKNAGQTSAPVLQLQLKHGNRAAVSFYFCFPLSHLKEVGGSSKVSLSKFLLSEAGCDKHVEMLRNATLGKPKGQQRLGSFCLGRKKPPSQGEDLVRLTFWRPPTPLHTSLAASARSGLPLKYHLAVTNYS